MRHSSTLPPSSPLYAHHVDWKHLLITAIILVYHTATILSSGINGAGFYLNAALTFLFTGFLLRQLFSRFRDVAVPNTFLINQFCAGIIPTYFVVSILSELVLFAVASCLFGGAVYVRARQALRNNPNVPLFSVIIDCFVSFNFPKLVETLRNSIWSVVFHAPAKEAAKWILVRRYHRVTLLPRNVAVHRSISPDGIVAVAVSSAAGFAIVPALYHASSWPFSSHSFLLTAVFHLTNALIGTVLFVGLEVGSTLFIALCVATRLRHSSSGLSVFSSYLVAVFVHIDWLPMAQYFYRSGSRPPVFSYVDLSRLTGFIIIYTLCVLQARVLQRRPLEHSD